MATNPLPQPQSVKSSQPPSSAPPIEPKRELTMAAAKASTGFAFPEARKWLILSIIFIIQSSMNLNASIYGNAVSGLKSHFGISSQMARTGQAVFLIAYAFGCELWAPWSEEYGRRPIMQFSLLFVNLTQIPCALATDYRVVLAARVLGGLSSAGGSVTLAVVADMFETDTQQLAVAFVSLSSVGGSVLGPIFGGFIEVYLGWRWVFWVSLIFGVVAQILHFRLVPETRATCMLDQEARRRRKDGGDANIWGPNEIGGNKRITIREVVTIWWRPFEMFIHEPIVSCLSLLSGFSDALIFTFLEAYHPVYSQYGFGPIQVGLIFVALLVGYILAYFTFYPTMLSQRKKRAEHPGCLPPESRLWWLQYLAVLLPLGLFGYACTSIGSDYGIPWWVPTLFTVFIGMANYGIYTATIDYMIAAYGPYSASATGGNGFARDFLAGVAAWYSGPFFERFHGKWRLAIPSWILASIAAVVCIPVFVIYRKGAWIRLKSRFAQTLEHDGVLQTHPEKAQEDSEKKAEEQKAEEQRQGAQANVEESESDEEHHHHHHQQEPQHHHLNFALRGLSIPNLPNNPQQQAYLAAEPRNMSITSLSGRRGLTIRQQSFAGSFHSPYASRLTSPVNSRPGSRQGHQGLEARNG